MILEDIIRNKRIELEESKKILPIREILNNVNFLPSRSNFKSAITRPGKLSLIAEIKKMSPSAGIIFRDFNPKLIAKDYIFGGARALSVLTDNKFFGGNPGDIRSIKLECRVPILRKDFIIDKYQVFESKQIGADAVLLIVRLLKDDELKTLIYLAREIGLEALVEVHSEEELKRAIAADADIIGINNRDLDNLKIDLGLTERLIKRIPKNITVVSESGIKNHADLLYVKNLGVNAVLIGETFLKSDNIPAKVKEVMGD